MVLSISGKNNEDGNFDWKDAVIDAAVMGGLTFCTSLGGMSVISPITEQTVIGAAVAAATQFFLVLAIKRGLREKE